MISKDLKKLLQKLNGTMTRALEAAAGFSIARGHYEVTTEHLLAKLLEAGDGDLPRILDRFDVDNGKVWEALMNRLEGFKTGNTGRPAFSPLMLDLVERAWVAGSVHHGATELRSGFLLEALLEAEGLRMSEVLDALQPVKTEALREDFYEIVAGSAENQASRRAGGPRASGAPPREGETALDLYTENITQKARDGGIDPVFARDTEIRQMIDVLSRRRKNNPILVGEAGVGKSAVLEGFALRLAEGDVPDSLKEVEIVALDLGLLQAGAGVKGEFENRLKSVIQEVKEAAKPTILFIDEAHTLIGAGGAAGTADAANLLKPALARGELRTVAATTWSEYKKYIEKDPALERRFQMIKVDEPSVDDAAIMMRGIKAKYEDHHDVQITDAAAHAAASLSERYITGRHLPDKAVDLMDTASARVKMSQSSKPGAVDDVERRLLNLAITATALQRDLETGLNDDQDTLDALEIERGDLVAARDALLERWEKERDLVKQIEGVRRRIMENVGGDGAPADHGDLRDDLNRLKDELAEMQKDDALVHAVVNEHVVAQIIADWTGIPVGNMEQDEAQMLLDLEDRLRTNIKGQNEALDQIADSIRTAKAGMGNPDAPIAVFLLVGPSGTGKTETAKQLAELMFGGERFLITINMSEYQEAHTVSSLKGSPPGYVGYGEGGVLTEAVRQRPYSVVLLDETEKAHLDVMELFYQVLDSGFMRDGEGREINFKNTIILMTSNIGSETVVELAAQKERPDADTLRAAIHPQLVGHFQAALLARMKVVPFFPLDKEAISKITRLKLDKIGRRLRATHGMAFAYGDEVVDRIAERCTQVDSGARNIDFIIDRTLLPEASRALLAQMADEQVPARLELGITERGDFTYTFDGVRYGGDGDGSEEEPEGDGPEAAIAEDLVPDGEADAAVSPSAGDGEVGEAGEPERPEAPAE
jgi:type VI secretion system protein VasG